VPVGRGGSRAEQLSPPVEDIDAGVVLRDQGLARIACEEFRARVADRFELDLERFDPSGLSNLGTLTTWADAIGGVAVAGGAPGSAALGGAEPAAVAYTLQVGRQPMEERLAVVADTLEGAARLLGRYLEGEQVPGQLFTGSAGDTERHSRTLLDLVTATGATADLLRGRRLEEAAALWVEGVELDWPLLYGQEPPRKVPLPGYPFARERCWVSPLHTGPEQGGNLHPLLHRNVSALDGICFETVFTGQEPVLTDHRVDGESVLPSAAYLEMAWSAAGVALPAGERENGWRLRDVFWLRPLTGAEAERGVRLTFEAGPSGGAGFSVRSASPGGPDGTLVHCEGTVEVGVEAVAETLDLEALRAQCDGRHFEGARYYEIFAEMGIDYGPAHQVITSVHRGAGQALAELRLPDALTSDLDRYTLHPSLVDAGLQAALALALPEGQEWAPEGTVSAEAAALPFAVDSVEVLGPVGAVTWAYLRRAEDGERGSGRADLLLCDSGGEVAVRLNGVAFRPSPRAEGESLPATRLLFTPTWSESPVPAQRRTAHVDQWTVLLCDPPQELVTGVREHLAEADCRVVTARAAGSGERYREHLAEVLRHSQELIRDHGRDRVLLQVVTPMGGERSYWAGLSGFLRTL